MTTSKPRIYISVSHSVHESLSRIARARSVPLAGVVSEILEEMGPTLSQIAHMTELARLSEDLSLSGQAQLNIEGAKIEEALGQAQAHLDRIHAGLSPERKSWSSVGRSATVTSGCESAPRGTANPLPFNKGVSFRGKGGSKGKPVMGKDWESL